MVMFLTVLSLFFWQSGNVTKSVHTRRTASIGKWFHHKESSNSIVKKKDRARVENARVLSAVSIAGLAAALASVAATENSSTGSGSKMSAALASATELLASHCIEVAEAAGADHDRVASVVRSAVDIQSPGDLMTLTASAATGTSIFFQNGTVISTSKFLYALFPSKPPCMQF